MRSDTAFVLGFLGFLLGGFTGIIAMNIIQDPCPVCEEPEPCPKTSCPICECPSRERDPHQATSNAEFSNWLRMAEDDLLVEEQCRTHNIIEACMEMNPTIEARYRNHFPIGLVIRLPHYGFVTNGSKTSWGTCGKESFGSECKIPRWDLTKKGTDELFIHQLVDEGERWRRNLTP